MRPTLSSRRRTGVLYAGVALFVALAAFTARSIWSAWQDRSGEAKAEAVFDLVQQRMPSRPTEAPGAMAWLQLELGRYRAHLGDTRRGERYAELAAAPASAGVPLELHDLVVAMAQPAARQGAVALEPVSLPDAATALRRERLATYDRRTFVITRRRLVDTPTLAADTSSNRFIDAIVPRLTTATGAVNDALRLKPLPAVTGAAPPVPVRLYAVSEDGTLVSLPWAAASDATGTPGGDTADRSAIGPPTDRAAAREMALLGGRPALPTFAPEDFFFRFDPSDSSPTGAYSGFYLDLGGRGLVSTITLPIVLADGQRGVLALDLAFDIDWRGFAATVEPPVVGTAVSVADASHATWSALHASLEASDPAPLRSAISELASMEQEAPGSAVAPVQPSPVRHTVVENAGAVAAFQVSDRTWLLMLFPKTAPAFPLAAVALLGAVLVALLAGFEVNRRRADDARARSERALAEKQNLLNTMQVPLVVVDPNTDEIVSANRAAQAIGIRARSRFADLVRPDASARAHYEKMQVASLEPRRAYGVPVNVIDEHGQRSERYAVVRSVAVTAPIEALEADERHRLGILFLLEPDADLALLATEIEEGAHRDERRRLAGLLSHGVDTLARVLEHALTRQGAGSDLQEFAAWLADYLERRLTVTAWVLDHWDSATPLPHDSVVDAQHARATIDRMTKVFALVRGDRDLRARLHWDNGALSAAAPDGRLLDVRIDWPDAIEFTCPIRGGMGYFLGEVLSNAMRHGAPGSVPAVVITGDRVRKEVWFSVENQTTSEAMEPRGESYGGVEILKALARLFEWTDLAFESSPGRFIVRWRIPAGERASGGQAD